ncbi:MAG TPA: spore germination protein GerW family protein [Chthonomonadaceae bacterium]|nr:spore germination protein GerW family protein [Chthonomonadaceae bacterium]
MMMTETDHSLDIPRLPGRNTFVERLGEMLGGNANARTIYGDPVERDGVTVIPVAKVSYGFGGGGGGREREGGGSGGGGGLHVVPIGYIEIKNGESTFRPIQQPPSVVPIIVAGAFTALIVMRGITRLLRGAKEK